MSYLEKLKKALLARCYGAGDIKVALILGEYPPPHWQLDALERSVSRGWKL